MHTSEKQSWLSRSYIGRHWRGELTLPVSYFVSGIAGNIVALIIVSIFTELIRDYTPWLGFFSIVGSWSMVPLIALWQVVGIWRSASNHPSRGGRVAWETVAKFMVIVNVMYLVGIYTESAIPQIKESFLIAVGDSPVGTFSMRILNQGTEIEFTGGIPFGATKKLTEILDTAPQINTIHLNSSGGRVVEAEKMMNVINQRNLNTYVSTECLSACTIAYLGGHTRYLNPNGFIGFHGVESPGIFQEDLDNENQRLSLLAENHGVSRSFARKAYSSSWESMWFPSAEELIHAGFATRMASGQFAISGFGPNPSFDTLADTLKETSLYMVLSEIEPAAFGEILAIFHNGVTNGLPEKDVYAQTRAVLPDVMKKYVPFASDEALLNFGSVLVDIIKSIGTKNKLSCYSLISNQKESPIYLQDYLTLELAARESNAMEMIIITGATGHHYDFSEEKIAGLYDELFTRISNRYARDILEDFVLLDETSLNVSEKERICDLSYVLYREMLSLPEKDAAYMLRYLSREE